MDKFRQVLEAYPYEAGNVKGVYFCCTLNQAMMQWRKLLCNEVGMSPDNKQTFLLQDRTGGTLCVQFWDGAVAFGEAAIPRKGKKYYVLNEKNEYEEREG